MEKALIIGASGGIGQAVAGALRARGVAVTGLSRSADGLDVTRESAVEAALGRLDGPYDLILVATGALEINGAQPEKALKHVTAGAMMDQFALNCIGPSLILKHGVRLLPRDRRAVFAALSARVGSIGDNGFGGWYSYRTAKAALNQMIHTAAIELGRSHREAICVALHPGTVRTAFTEKYLARHPSVPPEDAAENLLGVIDGLTPDKTGLFLDWRGKSVPW
ncbi:NAD(P)-dependent dehydrogenase, short-chain alcohol dehydrogenase family [Salinihabitans flavidus]|uniref:NAD(P)-dependent dehydrogenase, short-chain alcohol dehydrogenase family n=1 Tax=Salinihabitans flavidus TaxID=569882 RepID=A0A1H8MQ65_9RHOB|nr:SDR family NAD(P)-dependent oxidoreductase [Salinihabitans flavidus]SEO19601.1 NAD(P)-dependent dehydrogenase, short-chain alcohol dehydrogenase family [Salinihabitans flavidus]